MARCRASKPQESGRSEWSGGYGTTGKSEIRVDVSDEKNPTVISRLALEVNDPASCSKAANDPTHAAMGGYSNTYCSADNNLDAKLLACGFAEGGLRVFDIRNPARPREIAYYKPPAWRTQIRRASFYGPRGSALPVSPAQEAAQKASTYRQPSNDHTADAVMMPIFKNNGTEIWFVSADGGFHVVRFTDRFKAAEKGLF